MKPEADRHRRCHTRRKVGDVVDCLGVKIKIAEAERGSVRLAIDLPPGVRFCQNRLAIVAAEE